MLKSQIKYYFILLTILLIKHINAQTGLYKGSNADYKNSFYFGSGVNANEYTDEIRMDSIITISTQGISSKHLFQYNQHGKISEWLVLDNIGFNSSKIENIYDEDNRLRLEINFGWNQDKWDSLARIIYYYNTKGFISYYVFQTFTKNAWLNSSQTNYEYDSLGNLTRLLHEDWQNEWLLSSLNNYFYSNENRVDSILFQIWIGNDWQNDKKTIFYYNESQIGLDSLVVKSWNGINWINYLKRNVSNDSNNNQIEQLDQIWNFNNWQNSIRRFFTYNSFNFITDIYCELWINDSWVVGDGDMYLENPDGFKAGFITNSVSVYYSKTNDFNDTDEPGFNNYSLLQNYPNPFNPETKINFSLPHSGKVEIIVFDILGNEIETLVDEYKLAGIYEVEFNANNLPSGIYIYRLISADYMETKKMVLLR